MQIKPIYKRIAIVSLASAAALFVLVGVVINVVVTPEKITPIVVGMANDCIDGNVDMEEVDVTFFSSFPRVGVKLKNGCVVSHAFHKTDTVPMRRDTLAVFSEAFVGINIAKYLFTGDISIGRIRIDNPEVRLICDSTGTANWDIMKSDEPSDSTDAAADGGTALNLKSIRINNARIIYADRASRTLVFTDSLDLRIDGNLSAEAMDADIELSDRKTSVIYDGTRYLRRMALALRGNVSYNGQSNNYALSGTTLQVNGVDLRMDGWLQPDSAGMNMNIAYGLSSPSVDKIFALIPSDIISSDIAIEDGSVSLSGNAVGRLSDTEKPVIDCNLTVGGIKAKYEGMPYGIDDLSAEFNTLIDAQKPDTSFMNLDIFHFKGGKSEVEATVKISRLLSVPTVKCKVKSTIDLNSVTEVFPIANTRMSGCINADVNGTFRISDITRQNYGRMRLNGRIDVDSMSIVNDTTGLNLSNDAHVTFAGRDTLNVDASINKLMVDYPDMKVRVRSMRTNAKTLMQIDTTAIVTFIADCSAKQLFVKSDTVVIFGKNISARSVLKPTAANKAMPHVAVTLNADTIFSGIYGTRGLTEQLSTNLTLDKVNDTTWLSSGYVDVKRVRVGTPQYALPIVATDTRVTQNKRTIAIERANVRVGQTTASVSGEIHNLYYSLMKGYPLSASITANADTINFNELMSAIVDSSVASGNASNNIDDEAMAVAVGQTDTISTDSIPQRVYSIPKRIRFNVRAKANTVLWNKLQLDNVNASADIVNSSLHMQSLTFRQGDSRAIATLAYKGYKQQQTADLKCFVRWERADIGQIVGALDIDTIMPMLKPLRGKVDCYMAAALSLDSALNADLSTAQLSMHVGAKRLVLMDGETFAKISKVLMFKNKKENVIDTVSFNVLVDSNRVQILPFVTNIDRYKAVVGGEQDLDMNLNYHISILKSPLPFKAGVTISGTPEDMDIDITTAKLKKLAAAEHQLRHDSISLAKRMDILRATYQLSGLPLPQQLRKPAETDSIGAP